MCLTTTPAPQTDQDDQAYFVRATGDAGGTDPTEIRFHQVTPFSPTYFLKFEKAGLSYNVCTSASANSIIGSTEAELSATDISFRVWDLFHPNSGYVVLESSEKIGEDSLYLSSDGAGNMKLIRWNKPIPGPPDTTEEVDPALLFRVVRPFGQS